MVDCDADGLADGWELYVMFGTNTVWSGETAGVSPLRPNEADNRLDGFAAVAEKLARGIDPWNGYTVWEGLKDDSIERFSDKEAIDFDLSDGNLGKDEDHDGLSNWQELLSYRADPVLFADLAVTNAWSDGETLDYFRTNALGLYLGQLFNGGEFIEPEARLAFGLDDTMNAATRLHDCGWRYWDVARYSYAVASTNGFITPMPPVTLNLKAASTTPVTVNAYKAGSTALLASWQVASSNWVNGAMTTVLGTPAVGALLPGQIRFEAKNEAGAIGSTIVPVGWAGAEVSLILGESATRSATRTAWRRA